MIFYFTGTGNSLYAADKIAKILDDKVVDISALLKQGKNVFRIGHKETVGFVFPVYYGGMPTVVRDFISTLRFDDNTRPYVYAVITCGAGIAACDKQLFKALDKRRIELNCVFDVRMPDNYVIMYNPCTKARAKKVIEKADNRLAKIAGMVRNRSRRGYKSNALTSVQTAFMYSLYGKNGRPTRRFFADYNCIGCGKCVEACPIDAIELYKGKPRWTKDNCTHCTACINGCPQKALQYGKGTIKRTRYINNILIDTEVNND